MFWCIHIDDLTVIRPFSAQIKKPVSSYVLFPSVNPTTKKL